VNEIDSQTITCADFDALKVINQNGLHIKSFNHETEVDRHLKEKFPHSKA